MDDIWIRIESGLWLVIRNNFHGKFVLTKVELLVISYTDVQGKIFGWTEEIIEGTNSCFNTSDISLGAKSKKQKSSAEM